MRDMDFSSPATADHAGCGWQRRCSILAVLVLSLLVASAPSRALVPQTSSQCPRTEWHDYRLTADRFLDAVDRGELRIFGTRLQREMLQPRRVDCSYDLQSAVRTVTVYAELLAPLAVTELEGCSVQAVSAMLDAAGGITDWEAHIWCR